MYGQCSACCRLYIVCLGFLAEVDIHGKHPSWDIEPRRSFEVLLELDCVHYSRHDDQLEISSFGDDLFDEAKKHISVKCTLVRLIKYDH